jgi:hypothetical protein
MMKTLLHSALLAFTLGLASFQAGCASETTDAAGTTESQLSATDLRREADRIRAEATRLAGGPSDIPQRAIFLYEIYADSNGNHAFPLVALHGALWGHDVLGAARLVERIGGPLVRLVKLGSIEQTADDFADAIETINRQVFVDTYTNYWFTKKYGNEPGASAIVDAKLLPYLNRVHAAVASGESLSAEEQRATFLAALESEQDTSVARRMDQAAEDIPSPWLKMLMTRPVLHFTYFPATTFYSFDDFSDRADRVRCATFAYDTAVKVGWDAVADSMSRYGVLPHAYFEDRAEYARSLKAELLSR